MLGIGFVFIFFQRHYQDVLFSNNKITDHPY